MTEGTVVLGTVVLGTMTEASLPSEDETEQMIEDIAVKAILLSNDVELLVVVAAVMEDSFAKGGHPPCGVTFRML